MISQSILAETKTDMIANEAHILFLLAVKLAYADLCQISYIYIGNFILMHVKL